MKIKHKNSGEIFDFAKQSMYYYKHNSKYGWLVLTKNDQVLFFDDECTSSITDCILIDEFEILS
jgi:hypothetical protein